MKRMDNLVFLEAFQANLLTSIKTPLKIDLTICLIECAVKAIECPIPDRKFTKNQ